MKLVHETPPPQPLLNPMAIAFASASANSSPGHAPHPPPANLVQTTPKGLQAPHGWYISPSTGKAKAKAPPLLEDVIPLPPLYKPAAPDLPFNRLIIRPVIGPYPFPKVCVAWPTEAHR